MATVKTHTSPGRGGAEGGEEKRQWTSRRVRNATFYYFTITKGGILNGTAKQYVDS